jgi:hypothetical protein
MLCALSRVFGLSCYYERADFDNRFLNFLASSSRFLYLSNFEGIGYCPGPGRKRSYFSGTWTKSGPFSLGIGFAEDGKRRGSNFGPIPKPILVNLDGSVISYRAS